MGTTTTARAATKNKLQKKQGSSKKRKKRRKSYVRQNILKKASAKRLFFAENGRPRTRVLRYVPHTRGNFEEIEKEQSPDLTSSQP